MEGSSTDRAWWSWTRPIAPVTALSCRYPLHDAATAKNVFAGCDHRIFANFNHKICWKGFQADIASDVTWLTRQFVTKEVLEVKVLLNVSSFKQNEVIGLYHVFYFIKMFF